MFIESNSHRHVNERRWWDTCVGRDDTRAALFLSSGEAADEELARAYIQGLLGRMRNISSLSYRYTS
jgi:hypothetical protein